MVAPTASIELYLDGTRVPSTPGELAGGVVTVLDNLRLTWGRDGQNEQPGPAATVFELVDPPGGGDALDVVHVGSKVAVWAQGDLVAPGTTWKPTFDDGTFTAYPTGTTTTLAAAFTSVSGSSYDLTTTVVADAGGKLVRVTAGVPRLAPTGWTLILPPRAFSPAGQLPNAWDDIPKLYETDKTPWRWFVRVKAPAGCRIGVGAAKWKSPYATVVEYNTLQRSADATGDWQSFTFDLSGYQAQIPVGQSRWAGLAISVTGLDRFTWAQQTGTWAEQTGTWAQIPAQQFDADDVGVDIPVGAVTTRRVLVFSGEVSDMIAAPWGDRASVGVTVTAVDLGGQLGQSVVGDTAWPVQTVATRANRIAQLGGIPLPNVGPRVRIDPPLDTIQVSARDVDAQPSYALLQDLAQSAGGVLWAATHAVTGPYLWMENPQNRAAVRELVLSGGFITITAGDGRGVVTMSACDLLEDGVLWAQDTGDVVSVVAVTWAEQGPVDPDTGLPTVTERTVTVTDTAALTTYGTRRLSISTELISDTDATSYAQRVLAQARAVGWRLEGVTFDTAQLADTLGSVDDATRHNALMDLLDGTTRMGAAVTLVDMPAYAPRGSISSVYVDGGTYTYTGDAWQLALATTPAAGQGSSAAWSELDPTWAWSQWSASIEWQDLFGVAA
jgi:hypothetical protein